MWGLPPEQELKFLERLKRRIELDIKHAREELSLVNEFIEELKKEVERMYRFQQPISPPHYRPVTPPQFPQAQPTTEKISGSAKIAVATLGPNGLDDQVSQAFGRAPYFTIVTIENGEIKDVEVVENIHAGGPSGVGIAAVQLIASKGVSYVIAGRFGPNASAALSSMGIKSITVTPGISVRDAIKSII